jgi:hypothetical protein
VYGSALEMINLQAKQKQKANASQNGSGDKADGGSSMEFNPFAAPPAPAASPAAADDVAAAFSDDDESYGKLSEREELQYEALIANHIGVGR